MKRWNVFLPEELIDQVKELAKKRDVPAADVVRTACEKYLAAVKKAEEAAKAAQAAPAAPQNAPQPHVHMQMHASVR
jgi:metal-responsive CopG/Arc/MetJ family transcriptional regulator